MIGWAIMTAALLMLCLELVSLYMQLCEAKEKAAMKSKQDPELERKTSKEYYKTFDLAATDLKRTGRKRLKNDRA